MYDFNLFSSFHQCSTREVNVYLKIHLKLTYSNEFPDLSAIIEPTILCKQYM